MRQATTSSAFLINGKLEEIPNKYWGRFFENGVLSSGCGAFRCEFYENRAHKKHRHPNHSELVFVVKGRITQWIDGLGEMSLKGGDAAQIGRNVRHYAIPKTKNTVVLVVLCGKGSGYESIEEEEMKPVAPKRSLSKALRRTKPR